MNGNPGRLWNSAELTGGTIEPARAEQLTSGVPGVADDAFIVIDGGGRFRFISAGAERLLRCAQATLVGRTIWDAFPEVAGTGLQRGIQRALVDNVTTEIHGYATPAGERCDVRAQPTGDGLFVSLRPDAFADPPAPGAGAAVPTAEDDGDADELYRHLTEATPLIAWTTRPDGTADFFNARWFEYTGSAMDAAAPLSSLASALHPRDVAPVLAEWQKALQHGAVCEGECRLRRGSDGTFRWHVARIVPVRDSAGGIVKWFGTLMDVDDQKRADEGLRFLASASAALTASLDYEATLTSVARLAVPALADWCIVDELEDDGTFHRVAIVHADAARTALAWEMERRYPTDPGAPHGPAHVLRSGRPEFFTQVPPGVLVALTADGGHLKMLTELGFSSYMCAPLVARGRTMGAITFISGPSNRSYGAVDLALLEDLARRAALAVDNARLYEAEQQARRAAERSAGRTARLQEVTAALSAALTAAQVARVIVAQAVGALHADAGFVGLLSDGGIDVIDTAGYPDEVLGRFGRIALDAPVPVAEVMRTREAIWIEAPESLASRYPAIAAEHAERGHAALASIPLALEDRVVGGIVLGFPEPRTFSDDDRALLLALARQGAQALERARLYEAERSARADAEAAAKEVQRTQERVVESERLRALGEMASGIAHDFNNMLAVILGRCDLLLNATNRIVDSQGMGRHLEVIRQAAWDGEETVKRLQVFSGISRRPANGVMDLGAIVREVVEFTRPRWKDGAQQRGLTVQVEVDAEPLAPQQGSPSELREVLVNMVFNALDAMPGGGTVRLVLRRVGDEVRVQVIDNGVGMPESVQRRVFEPFFSTKETRGAGLGLSMSYGIITRMGGRIDVASTRGAGTTFTIVLPYREATAEESGRPAASVGPLSILLVDDEAMILETTRMMLELDGHQVTTAASGAEALQLLQESAAPGEESIYDVVLTDLGMPGMNGMQLLAAIRAAAYTLPCLLVTGWGIELAGSDVEEAGAQAVLPKPFSIGQLRAALAGLV